MNAIKILTTTLVMLLLTLSLASCSSDNNDEPDNPANTSIVGHWLVIVPSPYGIGGIGYTFESNGTGYLEQRYRDDSNEENPNTFIYERTDFTYKCNGNNLTVVCPTDEDLNGTTKFSIKGDKMMFTYPFDEDEDEYVFTRYDESIKEMLGN